MDSDIQRRIKELTRITSEESGKVYWSKRSKLHRGESTGWYQSIPLGGVRTSNDPRALERTEHVLDFIPSIVEPEDSVLDIGCKEGLFTLTAAEICQQATGVDIVGHHVEKARFVQETWASEGRRVSHAKFEVCNVIDHMELIDNHSVIFLLKIVYLLGRIPGALEKILQRAHSAKTKCILVQGHVTQTPYGDIDTITKLLRRHGFDGKLLRNVTEYPILLFAPRGSSFLDRVPATKEVPRRIVYKQPSSPALPVGVDPNNNDFDQYRAAFEDYLINCAIPSGKAGKLEFVPIEPGPLEDTPFGEALGVQKKEANVLRVRLAAEFFDLLEWHGDRAFFSRYARSTAYYRYVSERIRIRVRRRKALRVIGQIWARWATDRHIRELVTMYRRMKRVRGLVPSSKAKTIQYTFWSPEDFPIAIDYCGYVKRRDGAHRRMILYYIGENDVESMVVRFKDLDPTVALADAPRYLREGFAWFKAEVEKLRFSVDGPTPA